MSLIEDAKTMSGTTQGPKAHYTVTEEVVDLLLAAANREISQRAAMRALGRGDTNTSAMFGLMLARAVNEGKIKLVKNIYG